MNKLFGTDGIRGAANIYPMDPQTALAVGRAVAQYFDPSGGLSGAHIVIGQDTRISGDMLAQAVAAGVCAAGMDVVLLGVMPTPGIARLAAASGAAAGIVISASHNPYEDNGIKIFDGSGFKLTDASESEIENLILNGNALGKVSSSRIGRVKKMTDPGDQYLNFLIEAVPGLSLETLTIVLDCANGATHAVAPELFRRLGARVIPMFCDPDGININDQCGSQYPEQMAQVVVAQGADLGLAFDGDGDRLIVVDEAGKVLSGDQIMAICARDLQRKGILTNNVVVGTVMSNTGFHQALHQLGIQVHATQVGDRHVMQKMLAQEAVLGGEDSGHLIFRDVHTTGDGLMAALRLLDAVRTAGRPVSELAGIMTVYPQELINVDVDGKPDLDNVPAIVEAIAQAESVLGDQGRVLVRYSGTQNKCRVMVEGPTRQLTRELCLKIARVVKKELC